MAYKLDSREKEIENRLRKDYFSGFDAEEVLGDVDFAVGIPQDDLQLFEQEYLLWAEAKKSNTQDIKESIVQLVLTIGKARTFDRHLPPAFLGAFDAEKIAFVPYYSVMDVFSVSYINWNVRPSNHDTSTFHELFELLGDTLDKELMVYRYTEDDRLLRTFIRRNFVSGKSKISKVRINKTNFTAIYQKWLKEVKPTIAVNWESAKCNLILDADFYLADILSEHNATIREKLNVVLRSNHYVLERGYDENGLFIIKNANFNDEQYAHKQFWNRYERPPRREYWDYIVTRRDLLVPQDIREEKGSFFTPAQWVNLSQEYLEKEFGDNWQEEYYIWDCCAGTGNLLANLTNPYNIWASTIDKGDKNVMLDRIKTMKEASGNGKQGSNLLESHVFQFDFLNAPFSQLPQKLKEIIDDPEKRKRLIIYINPPYAEASNARTSSGTGNNRPGLSESYVKSTYKASLGRAVNELFAQFFARIYKEIPGCHIAMFSKLKTLQGPNFTNFRSKFPAKLGRIFLVPANTFDNVKGSFPIGFQIWHTGEEEEFKETIADVYDAHACLIGKKKIYAYNEGSLIIDWLHQYDDEIKNRYKKNSGLVALAYLRFLGTDFQNNKGVFWTLAPSDNDIKQVKGRWMSFLYVKYLSVYFSVRLCMEQTWLNDRDQFLWPDKAWENDLVFQYDCLVFMLFHGQNRISCKDGVNAFIPFTEQEVGAKDVFSCHFIKDYMNGVVRKENITGSIKEEKKQEELKLFDDADKEPIPEEVHFAPLTFSPAAQAVLDAGRELWRYYHQQPNAVADASFYDIRLYFQDTKKDKKGKTVMKSESGDKHYTTLLVTLRQKMKLLGRQIEPKVFEYGFLKRNYDPLINLKHKPLVISEMMPPMDEEAIVERPPQEQDISVMRPSEVAEAIQHSINPLGGVKVLNVNIGPQFNAPVGQVIMHADNINNKTE